MKVAADGIEASLT